MSNDTDLFNVVVNADRADKLARQMARLTLGEQPATGITASIILIAHQIAALEVVSGEPCLDTALRQIAELVKVNREEMDRD